MKLLSPLPGPVRPLPFAVGSLLLKGDSRGEIEKPAFLEQGGPVPPDPPGLPVVAGPRFARLGLALLIVLVAARLPAADPGIARKVAEVKAVAARGPFQPDWDSLAKFEVPAWYQDAKFGIFIHWGVYSVPAFGNEWYPRNMYKAGSKENVHHLETYGPLSRFGYKDFIPMFKAERFDAKRWAALFKAAGARYVVPVAEHHDGFPMYDYPFTEWSAVKMGPRRDVVGELAAAVRGEGLVFGRVLAPHRELVLLRRGPQDRFRRERRALRRPLRTRRGPGGVREGRDSRRRRSSWTTGWPAARSSWTDTSRSSCGSTGGSRSRPCTRTSRPSPPSTTTAGRSGGEEASRSTTRSTGASPSPIRPASWTSSGASSRRCGRCSGRPTPRSRRRPGATSGTTSTSPADSIVDDLVDIVSKNGEPAAQHRPEARRHDPRGRGGDAARDRGLAGGERGGDLRYAAVERLRRGPDGGRGGPVRRREAQALHLGGRALHDSRRPAVYAVVLAWPADGRLDIRSLASGSAQLARGDDPERGAPGLGRDAEVDAGRLRSAGRAARDGRRLRSRWRCGSRFDERLRPAGGTPAAAPRASCPRGSRRGAASPSPRRA